MHVISEPEFYARMKEVLDNGDFGDAGCVTGPGRSGALAAVYVSHYLHIPFIPFGQEAPANLGRILVVDTARESGATMRKAMRKYGYAQPLEAVFFEEPPRVVFWYESGKPQHYRHEAAYATSI